MHHHETTEMGKKKANDIVTIKLNRYSNGVYRKECYISKQGQAWILPSQFDNYIMFMNLNAPICKKTLNVIFSIDIILLN